MAYKIMVVEDQSEIRRIIVKYLENEAFEVVEAKNGFEALELLNDNSVHLIILDVMMPGIDGFEVLEQIRNTKSVPVIFLTAKINEEDRIHGFDLGCDDYIVKPFSTRELVRRVKAVIKRVYKDNDFHNLSYRELILSVEKMSLKKGDCDIELSTAEFKLLHTFLMHKGHVLTREQLIQLAFGDDYDGFDRNIDTYIKRIRQKIEDDPKNPRFIKTKYGAGYCFGGDLDEH